MLAALKLHLSLWQEADSSCACMALTISLLLLSCARSHLSMWPGAPHPLQGLTCPFIQQEHPSIRPGSGSWPTRQQPVMTVRGGWRKSLLIRNWRSTPEKDLALQLLLDSFLVSFLVGNCPLPGHQQTDLCGNEVLLESWGHLSQEGKHCRGIKVEAGGGQGVPKD